MVRNFLRRALLVLWLVLGLQAVAWAQEPAVDLTAFGTATAAWVLTMTSSRSIWIISRQP